MHVSSRLRMPAFFAAALIPALSAGCANHTLNAIPPSGTSVPQMQDALVSGDAGTATLTATASIVVRVPAAAAAAKSISIGVNGAAPVVASLSGTATGCVAATATQPLTCTVKVAAPAATDVFAVRTFSAANGTGTQLASATLLRAVAATGATVPLTLAGTVAALAVQLGRTSATECAAPTTIPVYLSAKDASGNTIVSGSYGVTVSLHDSDSTGSTHLSVASAPASSTAISLSYNGHKLGPTATISATASGVASSATTAATLHLIQQLYVLDANNQYIDAFSTSATGNVAPSRIINERGRMTAQARQIAISPNCLVYAADGGNNSIFAFPAGSGGTVAPVATLSGGNTLLNGPQGVAIDRAGKIYAPVYNSTMRLGGVGIWNAGATGNVAPSATILGTNTQTGHPTSLAFDGAGNLYVSDFRKVVVFAKGVTGNVAPLRILLTPALYCISGMSVDASGKIYITDCSNVVNVYAAGASGAAAPVRTINTGANTGPAGVAVDYANDVFTTFQRVPAAVSYLPIASGAAAPRTKIAGSSTTLNYPFNVAL